MLKRTSGLGKWLVASAKYFQAGEPELSWVTKKASHGGKCCDSSIRGAQVEPCSSLTDQPRLMVKAEREGQGGRNSASKMAQQTRMPAAKPHIGVQYLCSV